MADGWVCIYRSIQEHWIWKEPQKLKWWLDILLLANHKENKFLLGGKLIQLERGEHHTSELKLAERWQVDRKTIRKFLKLLESDGMIELKKTPQGTTIKVVNYNDYQDISEDEGTTERTAKRTTKRTTKPQQGGQQSPSKVDTNNNDNNDNNDNNKNNKHFSDDIEVNKAIKDFIEMRKANKKQMTDRAIELMLEKLEKLSDGDDSLKVKILEQSIANCWQGIFPLNRQTFNNSKNGKIIKLKSEYDDMSEKEINQIFRDN